MNKWKEIFLSNKESISDQTFERANMAAIWEMFMNCRKNVIGICKKTMTTQPGIIKGSQIWKKRYGLQMW